MRDIGHFSMYASDPPGEHHFDHCGRKFIFWMSSITGNWGLYGICNLCKEEMTIPTASPMKIPEAPLPKSWLSCRSCLSKIDNFHRHMNFWSGIENSIVLVILILPYLILKN